MLWECPTWRLEELNFILTCKNNDNYVIFVNMIISLPVENPPVGCHVCPRVDILDY